MGGFTLIELLVTVAIVAIIAGIALPSLMSSEAAQSGVSVSNSFIQDMEWARSQAISGEQNVSLKLNSDCSWSAAQGNPASVVTEHSMTSSQVQTQADGIQCSGFGGGVVMTFDGDGFITGAPASAVTFVDGPQSTQVLIFSSGVMVVNPQSAN